MRIPAAALATALGLMTFAACGTSTTTPRPAPFTVPVGAPPTYLGPVTSVYAIPDEHATIAPPARGLNPKFSWAALRTQVCHVPGGPTCGDPHLRVVARLGVLDTRSFGSPYIPADRLVYYVTITGIRCNTIIVSPLLVPPGSPSPKPWPTWCQSSRFVNAETGTIIGGGVGPMPGQ